jgi:hypothetical protein
MAMHTIDIGKKSVTISDEALQLLRQLSELQHLGLIYPGGDVRAQAGYDEGSIEVEVPATVTHLAERILGAANHLGEHPANIETTVATDSNDALRLRIRDLEAALEPFASAADVLVDAEGWQAGMHNARISTWLGPSDFIKAAAVLPTKAE